MQYHKLGDKWVFLQEKNNLSPHYCFLKFTNIFDRDLYIWKFMFSPFWRPDVWNKGVSDDVLHPKALEGNSLSILATEWSRLAPWLWRLLLCICSILLFPSSSHKDTNVFGVHHGGILWLHLGLFNSTCKNLTTK